MLIRAAGGDPDAVAGLFDAHWSAAWTAAFRLLGVREEADDTAQEAFIRSIRMLPQFERKSSYRTWLTRIAINHALDVLRRRPAAAPSTAGFVDGHAESRTDDADTLGSTILTEAVRRLPVERRIPVVLRYWLGVLPDEIAELTGTPLGTVHSRLARGVAELREVLEARRGHIVR